MSTTYLLKKRQEDENSPLELVTRKEWLEAIRQESVLSKEQRRYFIKDCIIEKGEFDCIYMEVSYKEYLEWNCEHMKQERNRQASLSFTHLSLENSLYASENARKIAEELVSEENVEDRILIFNEILTYLQTVRSRRMLWSLDIVELNKRISELSSQNQMLAALKQQGLIDPDIFISQSNELTEQLRAAKLDKERLLAADGDDTIDRTQELMEILEAGPDFLDHFDGELFGELIDKIIVDSNERVRFRLKNGLELTETIERAVR